MEAKVDKSWKNMSPKEKMNTRCQKWLSAEGIQFKNAEAEERYKKALKRFLDAIQLESLPDRVPIFITGTFLVANLYGLTPYEAMYDYDKIIEAHKRFLLDYMPDYDVTPFFVGSGRVLEILDYKQYRWPGHGVSPNVGYQYVEAEYMTEDEYDYLIDDPSDFWLRIFLPRICGILEPFKNLSPFTEMWEIVVVAPQMIPFGIPPVQEALKKLMEAGNEALAWIHKIGAYGMEAASLGFPGLIGGATKAPFDILGDTLRGTRKVMLDIYRRPELVLKAIERLTPLAIKQGVRGANTSGVPVIFIPLHKGADGFMSDEQFRKFYWPSLLATVTGLVEEGIIVYLFVEGGYNTRLEYLKELPRGACMCHFDRTDMEKAKKLLKDKVCIAGNIPAGLLLKGTPEEVKAYCKKLIDTVGRDGGYILTHGTALDEGNADNLRAMIEFTREYGVYK
ncbi:MAG: uroporphyrinogen decarboxylase [Deltaproteobacteria bacterium]|nr:uroporphyrinogen decarboxylase [Deltaproteobacteria bacterium]